MNEDTRSNIDAELRRVEEDCKYTGKAHFNATERLTWQHRILGSCAVISSAAAGTAIFADYHVGAGVLSLAATILTALLTFLKPAEQAAEHKGAGDQYLALKGDVRRFRTIRLPTADDVSLTSDLLDVLVSRQKDLNRAAPTFLNCDFQKARKGIEEGEALHEVDDGVTK